MHECSIVVAGTPSACTTRVRLTFEEVAESGGWVEPTTCAIPSTGSFMLRAFQASPNNPMRPVYVAGTTWVQALDGVLVRRQLVVPLAEHPEGRPEALLRVIGVERVVDIRHIQGIDRRGETLHLALASLDRLRERQLEE